MAKDKVVTREHVESLKADWIEDPCWDIFNTEGFEEYEEELKAFQEQQEAEWELEDLKELSRIADEYSLAIEEARRYRIHTAQYERSSAHAKKALEFYLYDDEEMGLDNQSEIEEIVDGIIEAAAYLVSSQILEGELGRIRKPEQPQTRPVDWYALYRQAVNDRVDEMVRNAGLMEQNAELLHVLAEVVAHPRDKYAQLLAEIVLKGDHE